jgi:RIO kinase 2
MYLSRLAAQKEYAFMKVLHREGFSVPEPVGWSRHTVVMEFIDAFPLRQIDSVPDPGKLYAELMEIIVQLAGRGLIHGDFNEFNILIREQEDETGKITLVPIVIDFPQTISTNHINAQMYFDRDVACIKRYFERRFKYTSDEAGPFFKDAVKDIEAEFRLDVEVEASGFSKKMAKELERYVETVGGDGEVDDAGAGDAEEEGKDDEAQDEDETEGQRSEEEEVPSGDQAEGPTLAAQLDSLTVEDDLAVKPMRPADFGLMPLELPPDLDAVTEKVNAKKKASGWAI